MQRSFLWDTGIFDGGWWALDRHEWEAVLGKKGEMKHGAKSAVRHKAKGVVKANVRNR